MRHRRSTRNALSFAALLAAAVTASTASFSQDHEVDETYEARAVNMSNVGFGRSTVVQIHVTRWSTEAERTALIATLVEQGQDELVKALRKQDETGFVRFRGMAASRTPFPSVRLRYAREIEREGKRRIILVTDRPVGMREAVRNPRTMDYDVSAIVMELERDGDSEVGSGQLVVGMKLGIDEENKTLVIEGFASEPVRLTRIERTK